MKTSEYLDALRVSLELPSDYALAAHFKVTRSFISNLRSKEAPMPRDMAFRAGKIIGRHRGLVLLDMELAKAKTPEEHDAWQEVFEGFRVPLLHAKSGMGHRLTR